MMPPKARNQAAGFGDSALACRCNSRVLFFVEHRLPALLGSGGSRSVFLILFNKEMGHAYCRVRRAQ